MLFPIQAQTAKYYVVDMTTFYCNLQLDIAFKVLSGY
jgi:hypothetical protein